MIEEYNHFCRKHYFIAVCQVVSVCDSPHSNIRVTERLMYVFSAQGSTGELWDSVKKAAFVIGSGILFLAAFGNSLTW